MEDRKVLFSCIAVDDSITETQCASLNHRDLSRVITSILTLCQESFEFKSMLHFMLHVMDEDPEFYDALKDATIDCPDFNNLLNDNDKTNPNEI